MGEGATRERCSRSEGGDGAIPPSSAVEAEPTGGENGAQAWRAVVATRGQEKEEPAPRAPTEAAATAAAAAAAATAAVSVLADGLAQVEALGAVGVRAFFDSLGLGACSDRLRESLDGAELARIARAPDPNAELLAAGVSARLHRVKLLSALGVGVPGGGSAEPPALMMDGGGAGGNERAPVAVVAALHMVRRLRREQGVVADALCRSCGTAPSRIPAESGREVQENGPTRSGCARGGVGGGGKEVAGAGVLAATGKGAHLVSAVLPELEDALSAQVRLSSQVLPTLMYSFYVTERELSTTWS